MEQFELHCGDCLEVLKTMPDNSVESVVSDPPYGLGFMNKKWDYQIPSVDVWKECLRVLKPGGFLLSFAGTRTYHRMAVNIEDAGFEVRDMICWTHSQGFPKSLNIAKAIDEKLGATGSQEAQQWDGWGSALKPAMEPICCAQKPREGTFAENVLKWGVGGLNIDACRIDKPDKRDSCIYGSKKQKTNEVYGKYAATLPYDDTQKRWPANFVLSYPEDEYILRDDITSKQLIKLAEWLNENTKY